MDIQTSLTSSLFREDTLSSLNDIKFTSLDITRYWNATVGTTDHNKTVARIRDEFDSPDDTVEYVELSYSAGKGATGTTNGCILNRLQVIRLFSRATGDTGKTVRRMTERYFERLEARVLEQQAELVNMRKVVSLLRERHADSPATNAFLLGITSELAGWHVTKATLVAVTQDSTGYAYERGKEFAITYAHRILPDESPAAFYARVQTDLDLEFVGAKPMPARDTL